MTIRTPSKLASALGVLALAALGAVVAVMAADPFVPSEQPVGYVGQPVVSSTNVGAGTAKMYAIDYSARDWSGNLHSYPISTTGVLGAVDDWGTGGASARIRAQSVAGTRQIVTIKDGVGIPFRWSELSSGAGGQREALDPASAASGATTSPLLDYLRGSSANEGSLAGQYRVRGYGLGDIIHSTPVYWDDGSRKTVFVGSNDGMLHAINAADGRERFAYVPGALLPRLGALASQSYAHRYYVDGRMDIRKFGARTVLAGTLGAGGKAVFALDVTNASSLNETDAAAKVLWEIDNTRTGFGDLGDTYGAPILTTLPDGTPALVMGNGYNNGGTGHAVLYIIHAITGARIRAFDTGSGSTASPNGLSSPALWDSDGDGKKDTAYAGDIDGNLWRFRLDAAAGTAPVKVHSASGSAAHAINMAPGLMAHPLGGVLVHFVTGRMLTSADALDTATHYAYGVWDGAPALNDTWLEQTLTEARFELTDDTYLRVRTATANRPDWRAGAGRHKGWRTRLPTGGERVVGDGAYVTGGVFQFFTTNPAVERDATPPGENWWMQLDAMTGGAAGLPLFDLDGDKRFTADDKVEDDYPAGRFMGGGVRSQLVALAASGVDVFQANFDRNSAPPGATEEVTTATVGGERGVSGGHFDTDFFCYRNCGGATEPGYATVRSIDGYYSIGRTGGRLGQGLSESWFKQPARTRHTDGLNYVHVHEYDDIYDRVGLNMLHPSQDLQRLDLGKAETSNVHVPNTPELERLVRYPDSGVTLVSNTVENNVRGRRDPPTTYRYSHGQNTIDHGYPQHVNNAGGRTTTTRIRYLTTLTLKEPFNVRADGRNRSRYDLRTTVRRWETLRTRVETVPEVRFKVLMANQAYSPAVNFKIDGSEEPSRTNATYNGAAFSYQSAGSLAADSLPSYRMSAIRHLVFSMPLDAFNNRDWGTGVERSGLHPVHPTCTGVAVNAATPGPLGEWRNGALTLQIVDSSVTDADIQLNVSGRPDLGYRLKDASLATKLIGEYLIYWHHPNDRCMADTGWSRTPGQDLLPSDAIGGVWAAGEDDPRGVFRPGTGQNPVAVPAAPAPVTVTNPDGGTTTTTVVHTALEGGGYLVTTTVRTVPPETPRSTTGIVTGGAVNDEGTIGNGIDRSAARVGRINWRELYR